MVLWSEKLSPVIIVVNIYCVLSLKGVIQSCPEDKISQGTRRRQIPSPSATKASARAAQRLHVIGLKNSIGDRKFIMFSHFTSGEWGLVAPDVYTRNAAKTVQLRNRAPTDTIGSCSASYLTLTFEMACSLQRACFPRYIHASCRQ